jgi:hypothetical protein
MPRRHVGNGGIAPLLMSPALDGGECSASCLSRSTPEETAPVTHWIDGWLAPRAGLNTVLKRVNSCGTMLQPGRSRIRIPMRWIFSVPNPSSRSMLLGSIQPLTEMSTRNLPGGVKGGRPVRLKILPPSVSRLSRENMGASTSHNLMGLHGVLRG